MTAIYNGRDFAGTIEATAAGFVARDADGRRLGALRLDVTAAHVLALRQPKPAKPKQGTTPRKADDRVAPPTVPQYDDAIPF